MVVSPGGKKRSKPCKLFVTWPRRVRLPQLFNHFIEGLKQHKSVSGRKWMNIAPEKSYGKPFWTPSENFKVKKVVWGPRGSPEN